MLSVQNLSVSYDGSRILRSVSLNVPERALVCLMGRNGVGKTTTLKAITGLVRSDEGTITLGGKNLSSEKAEQRARSGLGYVPQGRDIFPNLTVWENLKISLVVHGAKANGQVDRVLELFPVLKEMLKRKGGVLSGGQQQQLAIARALLTNPRVLILDEPTEGIQPNIIDQIGDAIRLLRRGGHHNEAGLLAQINQTLRRLRGDDTIEKSRLFDEVAELASVLLRDGVEKHPALFERFAEGVEKLRHENPTGTVLADEIGSALGQLRGEGKMSILLVEQYLDFCKELADTFAIMDRGAVVCAGPVAALTDDVVKRYLTV